MRLEILGFLCALGPCSIADLAHAMDRPADGLYRHVRLMQQHGMVVEVGRRRAGRRWEVVLDAAAEHYRVDYDPVTGHGAAAFRTLIGAALKKTAWTLRDADSSGRLRPGHNFDAACTVGWLTESDVARVAGLIGEIKRIFAQGLDRHKGELHLTTLVLTPVVRKRRARPPGKHAAPAPSPPIGD